MTGAAVSFRLLIVGTITGVGILLTMPEPLGALCSPSLRDPQRLPIVFEGRVIAQLISDGDDGDRQPNYRWIVERPIRGVRAGDLVDIVMSVSESHGNRIARGSNDIGPAPQFGIRYRVGAYRGEDGASDRLFTNACGGVLEVLEPPSKNVSDHMRFRQPSVGLIAALSAGLVLTVTFIILYRTRRHRPAARI